MLTERQAQIINNGSQTFQWRVPVAGIGIGASTTIRVSEQWRNARLFEPLDSIEVINNSGSDITLMLSPSEVYTIPAYMSKPIARKPFKQFTLRNDGAVAVAVNEITVHVKRLPPNVQMVANV